MANTKQGWVRRAAGILIGIGAAWFFVFLVTLDIVGGTAGNGKVVGGCYYVGDKSVYTTYTQVSQQVYNLSHWIDVTYWMGTPLCVVGIAISQILDLKDKIVARLSAR